MGSFSDFRAFALERTFDAKLLLVLAFLGAFWALALGRLSGMFQQFSSVFGHRISKAKLDLVLAFSVAF